MSRLEIRLSTNLRKEDEDNFSCPSIDYIVFKTSKGDISLSCNYESASDLYEGGTYDSEWIGVDYIADGCKDDAGDAREITKEIFNLLKDSGKIDAIGIYCGDNVPIPEDGVKVSDVEITLELNSKTESISFREEFVVIDIQDV